MPQPLVSLVSLETRLRGERRLSLRSAPAARAPVRRVSRAARAFSGEKGSAIVGESHLSNSDGSMAAGKASWGNSSVSSTSADGGHSSFVRVLRSNLVL